MERLIAFIFITLFTIELKSQDSIRYSDSELAIPSLSEVIDIALKNSPLLKIKATELQKIQLEIQLEKKKWTDYIFIEGNMNYGVNDQLLVSNQTGASAVNSAILNKNQQLRYYGGIGIKLPVSAILNRHNEIGIKKMEAVQSEYEQQQTLKEIKQLIIEEYYKLRYLEESSKTFQSIYQTLHISQLKAEKDVLSGKMDINNYALLVSTVGKSKDDLDKATNNFYAQYNKLQVLSGMLIETH